MSTSKTFAAIMAAAAVLSGVARAAQDQSQPRFAEEISVFGVEDEIYPPAPCATLFLGSSSIRFWFRLAQDFPKREIIRRGFGGSTIADANYYFDRIVAPYHPRAIVFYAGENDINAGESPEGVLDDLETFLAKKTAALGDTPVYFISIKPSKARLDDLPKQTEANRLIAALAARRADLVYVDVASAMLENGAPKDIFISDNLHMNHTGYAIWRNIIGKALRDAPASKAPNCQ